MEIETRANYLTILQSVQKRSPPDFIIFNHDVKYYCHFNVIAMSSKKIASMRSGSFHPPSITLKTKFKLHFLQNVINFFYGHPIIYDFTNYKEILILSNFFDSPYLKKISTSASSFFRFAQSLLESDYCDFSQNEIDFFASFFHVFSSIEIFNKFPFELMKAIIQSDKLSIISEDFLVDWILHSYNDTKTRQKLLNFVVFQKVSFKGFKNIFTSLQNVDEIKDKLQKEFVKNPLKRDLSLDRNNRYFDKPEFLTQKILNFDFSKVFSLNIEFQKSEEKVNLFKRSESEVSNLDEELFRPPEIPDESQNKPIEKVEDDRSQPDRHQILRLSHSPQRNQNSGQQPPSLGSSSLHSQRQPSQTMNAEENSSSLHAQQRQLSQTMNAEENSSSLYAQQRQLSQLPNVEDNSSSLYAKQSQPSQMMNAEDNSSSLYTQQRQLSQLSSAEENSSSLYTQQWQPPVMKSDEEEGTKNYYEPKVPASSSFFEQRIPPDETQSEDDSVPGTSSYFSDRQPPAREVSAKNSARYYSQALDADSANENEETSQNQSHSTGPRIRLFPSDFLPPSPEDISYDPFHFQELHSEQENISEDGHEESESEDNVSQSASESHSNAESDEDQDRSSENSPKERHLKHILSNKEANKLVFDSSDKDSDFF